MQKNIMREIEYSILKPGEADYNELYDFLVETDNLIIPNLSTRVNLLDYAKKLAGKATNFFARDNGLLIGVRSVYFNSYPEFSFSTYTCVRKEYQGEDMIGMKLGEVQNKYLIDNGARGIRFAIRKSNKALYKYNLKRGARVISENKYPGTDIVEVEMEYEYKL
ncbi:MAG: hypothetical protein J5542_04565 [Bacteroidales bacterium]|nr:hypothetical protein [Bacteroidales bacterium]